MQCSAATNAGTTGSNSPPTITSISDSAGNTWTADLNVGGASTGYAQFWHAANIAGGLNTFAADYTGGSCVSSDSCAVVCNIQEWTGIGTAPTIDSTNSTSSVSLDTGSIATSRAVELLIAFMNVASTTDSAAFEVPLVNSWPSSGFTPLTQDSEGSNLQALPAYQITAATGTYSSTGAISQTFGWQGAIVAYVPGGGPATRRPSLSPTPTPTLKPATPTPTLTPAPTPAPTASQTPTPAPNPSPVAAVLRVSPSNISFGKVRVRASKAKALKVTNTGRKGGPAIAFQSPGGSILGSSEFRVATSCTALGPNQTCSATITFSPTVSGAASGTVVLKDNADNAPQSISIDGVGK